MAMDRKKLVQRHNPRNNQIEDLVPLTVGNGRFAFTADVTGLQTLNREYTGKGLPLCTMSEWGWHTTPADGEKKAYTLRDLEWTAYDFCGRTVTYAVEEKKGNEEVYHWLRQNPHRFHLGELRFLWNGCAISPDQVEEIRQTLDLWTGMLTSTWKVEGETVRVQTCCHGERDCVGISVSSRALQDGRLSVELSFPYGSCEISGAGWEKEGQHESRMLWKKSGQTVIARTMDQTRYLVSVCTGEQADVKQIQDHRFRIFSLSPDMECTVCFVSETPLAAEEVPAEGSIPWLSFSECREQAGRYMETFWKEGAMVSFAGSTDARAAELERRIILSLYLTAVQSCTSMPPQETGLTCNSWYGKFHLEMYLWHAAFFPLWGRGSRIRRSLSWYRRILPKARKNAARNGYRGAKWPKMVAYDGIDSPSPIATLLIWQQPHIIYMLELLYQCTGEEAEKEALLDQYWEVVRETADYMVDLAVYREETDWYELCPPLIPAQEEHDPRITKNPTFEVEYWRFALRLAAIWAGRLGKDGEAYSRVAEKMAPLPRKDGVYLAHQNCPDTFQRFHRDHPSMVGAYGLIDSDRVERTAMERTLRAIKDTWDFSTMWGWDFAMMAMTETRLGHPNEAVDILMKETVKNTYRSNGNNYQRPNLPLYLPGNGSLLLAVAMMIKGWGGRTGVCPGFPDDGTWVIEEEGLFGFPY